MLQKAVESYGGNPVDFGSFPLPISPFPFSFPLFSISHPFLLPTENLDEEGNQSLLFTKVKAQREQELKNTREKVFFLFSFFFLSLFSLFSFLIPFLQVQELTEVLQQREEELQAIKGDGEGENRGRKRNDQTMIKNAVLKYMEDPTQQHKVIFY